MNCARPASDEASRMIIRKYEIASVAFERRAMSASSFSLRTKAIKSTKGTACTASQETTPDGTSAPVPLAPAADARTRAASLRVSLRNRIHAMQTRTKVSIWDAILGRKLAEDDRIFAPGTTSHKTCKTP